MGNLSKKTIMLLCSAGTFLLSILIFVFSIVGFDNLFGVYGLGSKIDVSNVTAPARTYNPKSTIDSVTPPNVGTPEPITQSPETQTPNGSPTQTPATPSPNTPTPTTPPVTETPSSPSPTPNNEVRVSGVSIIKGGSDQITVDIGDKAVLKATVSPSNATNKNIRWTSSNPSVVSISNNGNIEAKAPGTAVITVSTEDGGYTDTLIITVQKIGVSEVTLNKYELTLDLASYRAEKLTATVLPDDATDKTITWVSTDRNIATVDSNGIVRAESIGSCKIIVTTLDGNRQAECNVMVIDSSSGNTPTPPEITSEP